MLSLTPFIDEKFNGEIWRMEIDDAADLIFIEVRDSVERRVNFSSISLATGQIYFKDLATPERWLTGIEAACHGVLLLHFYENEKSPVHKGLVAIDGSTGDILWTDFNAVFDSLSINGPVVCDARRQPPKRMVIEAKTGETKRPYEPSVDAEQSNAIELPDLMGLDELPVALPLNSTAGDVHYASRDNYRIVSLHALNGGRFDQALFIFEEEATSRYREVFSDLLNTGIQKLQPEAFIIHKSRLIYIKNRSELVVLNL